MTQTIKLYDLVVVDEPPLLLSRLLQLVKAVWWRFSRFNNKGVDERSCLCSARENERTASPAVKW
ncbi:MAG TPA: hypothetical protein EYP49_16345 [Anaerolineae bacterium]|nr:hypothetical protein [Anaerolineae bacterium]